MGALLFMGDLFLHVGGLFFSLWRIFHPCRRPIFEHVPSLTKFSAGIPQYVLLFNNIDMLQSMTRLLILRLGSDALFKMTPCAAMHDILLANLACVPSFKHFLLVSEKSLLVEATSHLHWACDLDPELACPGYTIEVITFFGYVLISCSWNNSRPVIVIDVLISDSMKFKLQINLHV